MPCGTPARPSCLPRVPVVHGWVHTPTPPCLTARVKHWSVCPQGGAGRWVWVHVHFTGDTSMLVSGWVGVYIGVVTISFHVTFSTSALFSPMASHSFQLVMSSFHPHCPIAASFPCHYPHTFLACCPTSSFSLFFPQVLYSLPAHPFSDVSAPICSVHPSTLSLFHTPTTYFFLVVSALCPSFPMRWMKLHAPGLLRFLKGLLCFSVPEHSKTMFFGLIWVLFVCLFFPLCTPS